MCSRRGTDQRLRLRVLPHRRRGGRCETDTTRQPAPRRQRQRGARGLPTARCESCPHRLPRANNSEAAPTSGGTRSDAGRPQCSDSSDLPRLWSDTSHAARSPCGPWGLIERGPRALGHGASFASGSARARDDCRVAGPRVGLRATAPEQGSRKPHPRRRACVAARHSPLHLGVCLDALGNGTYRAPTRRGPTHRARRRLLPRSGSPSTTKTATSVGDRAGSLAPGRVLPR
jgi:hypothetical protein